MKIDSIRVGFISTNCYLLCDEEAGVCALIDPGDKPEQVADMVSRSGCSLEYILLTTPPPSGLCWRNTPTCRCTSTRRTSPTSRPSTWI